MSSLFVKFLKKHAMYAVAFVLIIGGLILPFPLTSKSYFFLAATALIYFKWFKNSFLWAHTIPRMILWIVIAPLFVSLLVIAYISVFWKEIGYGMPAAIGFNILFVLVWAYAACKFDKKKIKVAMSIVNALTLTVVALSFIFYFDIGTSLVSLNQAELVSMGFTPASFLEILIKIFTLPYLLGGFWGLAVWEIRDAKG